MHDAAIERFVRLVKAGFFRESLGIRFQDMSYESRRVGRVISARTKLCLKFAKSVDGVMRTFYVRRVFRDNRRRFLVPFELRRFRHFDVDTSDLALCRWYGRALFGRSRLRSSCASS